jgi:hypothetical protein
MRFTSQTSSHGVTEQIFALTLTLIAGQSVPEWRAVLDAVQELDHVGAGPVGYWGLSLGCGLGVPFVAAEPRVRAAVLGLNGAETSAEVAAQITVPVEFPAWVAAGGPANREISLCL